MPTKETIEKLIQQCDIDRGKCLKRRDELASELERISNQIGILDQQIEKLTDALLVAPPPEMSTRINKTQAIKDVLQNAEGLTIAEIEERLKEKFLLVELKSLPQLVSSMQKRNMLVSERDVDKKRKVYRLPRPNELQ